ncbi:hypothetical protein DACRYDRAFT_107983 [Dacryopinax primogenitus]|uniref:C2H2-type domain-containing protein n=1 Tax=Dacryopinax primogenitus (strain DJM 731) TaxID=1858805 RepID=M5GBP4_DACPD|nr:uncharacterized protein DACRYDRAFT_107983 [Dacryopinax primogenitus]EJU01433.1 hypothetical protein DACRYDRAFT_107983 [Dacryopinax primogenitus]
MSQPQLTKLYHCRWNWCRKHFTTSDALLDHVVEEHFATAEPVRAGDIPALRRAEEGWSFEQSFMPDFTPPDMSSIVSTGPEPSPASPLPALVQSVQPTMVAASAATTSPTHSSPSRDSYSMATTSHRRRHQQPQLVPDDSTATIPRLPPSGDPVPFSSFSPYRAQAALAAVAGAEARIGERMEIDDDPSVGGAGVESVEVEGPEANVSGELGEMEQYVRLSSPEADNEPSVELEHSNMIGSNVVGQAAAASQSFREAGPSEPAHEHLPTPPPDVPPSTQFTLSQVSPDLVLSTQVPTSTLPSEQRNLQEQADAEALDASFDLPNLAPPTPSYTRQRQFEKALGFSSPVETRSQPFVHTQVPPASIPSFSSQPNPPSSPPFSQPSNLPPFSQPPLEPLTEPQPEQTAHSQDTNSTESVEEIDPEESQDDIRPVVRAQTQMLFSAVADFLGSAPSSALAVPAPGAGEDAPPGEGTGVVDPEAPKEEPFSQLGFAQAGRGIGARTPPSRAESPPQQAQSLGSPAPTPVSPARTPGLMVRIMQGLTSTLARSSQSQSLAQSQAPQSQPQSQSQSQSQPQSHTQPTASQHTQLSPGPEHSQPLMTQVQPGLWATQEVAEEGEDEQMD